MTRFLITCSVIATLGLSACTMNRPASASANLIDPAGKSQGTATFTAENGGARVRVSVLGLKPGPHGMHIHVNPACTDTTDATGKVTVFGGSGGHFDPGSSNNHDHPTTDNSKGHVGDLPNLVVNENGVGTADFWTAKVSLSGANSVVGRSIVIHADPDDYQTDPAGNSGGRERCGVIGGM